MWLKQSTRTERFDEGFVSVLYREPMWLKLPERSDVTCIYRVSVLYREPMWLKRYVTPLSQELVRRFSALP